MLEMGGVSGKEEEFVNGFPRKGELVADLEEELVGELELSAG